MSSFISAKTGNLVSFAVDDLRASQQARDFIDNLCITFGVLYNYIPDISCVLKEYDTYEEKVKSLMRHSEKLATATRLLEEVDGDIEVSKNLRMCADCHTFAKLLSTHFKRKFMIYDKSFQHVFEDGKCSCNERY
ncbi:hypothetical protein AKO1_013706 [Acrasis kona]|uniref:DYW domain-containing protein n=1 Tax=Acrasis kona TaxID=1008807 RepID=A0AAW2ZIK2_9EUKA